MAETLLLSTAPTSSPDPSLICGVENGQSPTNFDPRRRYSRAEMEALQFAVDVGEQRRWWDAVYEGLGEVVARELDGISAEAVNNCGQNAKKGRKRGGRKKEAFLFGGEVPTAKNCKSSDILDSPQFDYGEASVGGHEAQSVEELCYEDDNVNGADDSSDEEYASIQRPAFMVEGEPNFDAGPPEDGLEYLRRVRWEAARIPKVRVAKVQSGKQIKEQTPYMPNIPEIPKVPLNLLPSKDWEKTFLASFSDLRQAFCQLESSCEQPPATPPKENSSKDPDGAQVVKSLPTLSIIRRMDFVSRAATLRNYICMFESATELSRNDCLWLFALSVVVDTPLDADTCASLRCLLRKCSDLLSMKSEPDDEVAMLNILITITGKFFGQSENT